MKKLFTTLLLSVFAVFQLSAEDNSRLENLTVFNPSSNWELIKEENGIKVYVKEQLLSEGRFIAVKFENATYKPISFSWKLTKEGKVVPNYAGDISLKISESKEFIDPTVLSLDVEEHINMFNVNILIKK